MGYNIENGSFFKQADTQETPSKNFESSQHEIESAESLSPPKKHISFQDGEIFGVASKQFKDISLFHKKSKSLSLFSSLQGRISNNSNNPLISASLSLFEAKLFEAFEKSQLLESEREGVLKRITIQLKEKWDQAKDQFQERLKEIQLQHLEFIKSRQR